MPDALHLAALLGHVVVDEEPLLLAWLESELPSGLREELDSRGVTGTRLRDALAQAMPAEPRHEGDPWGSNRGADLLPGLRAGPGSPAGGRRTGTPEGVLRACL